MIGKYYINRNDERILARIFYVRPDNIHKILTNHWHQGAEFIFCVKGVAEIVFHDEKIVLETGSFYYIEPYTVHKVDGYGDHELLFVQFPEELLKLHSLYDVKIRISNTNSCQIEMSKLCLKLAKVFLERKDYYHIELNELIFRLLLFFANNGICDDRNRSYIRSQKKFQELSMITSYIKKNYANNITQKEVAEQFGYHPQYFTRYFKQNLGHTFLEYLIRIRVSHSMKLLIETDYTIVQISEECGFRGLKSFNKYFKEINGCNPSHYRLKIMEKSQ